MMQLKLLFRWLGLSAAIAVLIVLGLSPAGEKPVPTTKAGAHKPKGAGARKARRLIPLQRKIELARQSNRDGNNEFHNPVECCIDKEGGACELSLGKKRFRIPGASLQSTVTNIVPQTFDLLCYNGKPVGPTIRIRRDKIKSKFSIQLKNDLVKGDDDPGPAANDPLTYETPHGLCTTNLHTHGLHVSPAGDADNIFRLIEPQEHFTFRYDILADHPSGTFWYHPHKHGSVAYQLSNGLAGALIVEREKKTEKNKPGDVIRYLEDIYEIAQAEEKNMVLQLYSYRVGDDGDARIDAGDGSIYNITPLSNSCKAIPLSGSTIAKVVAINGRIVPTIRMAPGEVQRWRIVHASWDELLPLTFADNNDANTREIQFQEIAVDGLATGKMEVLDKNILELAPGQRSDVLIQAPKIPEGQERVVYFLKQNAIVDGTKTLRGKALDPMYLARIVVAADPKRHPKVFSLPDKALLKTCRAFPDDLPKPDSPPPAQFTAGIQFNGIDLNQTYNINNRTFHNQKDVQIKFKSTQEWVLRAAPSITDYLPDGTTQVFPNNHPFHIHVNPFQVIRKVDADGKSSPMNVWRDTLLIKGGESYTIRTRFADFPGRTVLHCHILDHEDQGMMVPLNITDQVAGNGGQGANLKPASAPAPALKLPDAAGKSRDLAEFRRRNVILVFFQGAECSHCAQQLRDLVRDARESIGLDAEIVAVSSRLIANQAQALKILGVSPSDRFHLLADEGGRAFRAFGCYDNGPMHGLFLIDRDGIIRAKYTGESPFGDTKEAIRRVRALALTSNKTALR